MCRACAGEINRHHNVIELWLGLIKRIALLTSLALLHPVGLLAQEAPGDVTVGPRSSDLVAKLTTDMAKQPALTTAAKIALLRKQVKYVFVLFQENRSFDFYFGTFPGANGLFSKPASQTPGFVQPIFNTDGSIGTISPFLIPQTVSAPNPSGTGTITVPIYPADTSSVDHSHSGIITSSDFVNGVSQNDRFALDEEGLTTLNGVVVSKSTMQPPTSPATLVQKQTAELAMGHVDCDTAPFLWQLADRFTLFDNFHMTVAGPSTPNALALISGQSGLTQWALNPSQASSNTASLTVSKSGGEPICHSWARASRPRWLAPKTRRLTCSTSRRTSRPSPAMAIRQRIGAGSRKALTLSRPTRPPLRCTALT